MKRCDLKILSCGSCRQLEYLSRKNASLKIAEFPSYVGMIKHPDEGLALFDTGYDHAFFKATATFPERFYRWATPVSFNEADSVVNQLKLAGYSPDDVRTIIISHFHGDHVAGMHNFPNAHIFCSKAGVRYMEDNKRFTQVRHAILAGLLPLDLKERARYFEDLPQKDISKDFPPFKNASDIFGDGSLMAVELPGHCPGHWGLALRTGKDCFVFMVADAVWSVDSVEGNIPAPGITLSMLSDSKKYRMTLRDLHALSQARPNIFILPSHCKKAAQRYGKECI